MPTTADYINELTKQKNKLADTLNSKGVSADKTEKYNSLVNKVNDIVEVKGEEITLNNDLEDKNAALRFEYPNDTTKQISVKLSSKNILNPTLWSTAQTAYGVTVQYLPDEDCFLLNGTTTKTDGVMLAEKLQPNIPLDKGKYTLSATYVSGTVSPENRAVFYIGAKDDPTASGVSMNWLNTKLSMSNTSMTVDSRNYLMKYWFYWYGDITFTDYKVKLQFEKNSLATSYSSYISDFSASKIYRYGKNLFDKSLVNFSTFADSGAFHCSLIETLETGWILQGDDNTQTGSAAYSNGWARLGYGASEATPPQGIKAVIGQKYTLSYDITLLEKTHPDSTASFEGRISTKSGAGSNKVYYLTINEKKRIFLSWTAKTNEYIFPNITLNSNKIKIENVQIELGTEATDYENFIDKVEYTPATDSIVTGIQNLYPTTTLITDGSTIISEAHGVYKHILPSTDKNCFTKVLQPVEVSENV